MNFREMAWKLLDEVNQVILGKETMTREVLAALLAGGHILLEDIPGVGKTTLALAFSKFFGFQWKRVQFTPDVLPSDLTGFSIYRRDQETFEYQKGAVFCNLLLADEINRTSPKTQSALLEVMEEHQVTVDGVTREVPDPFFVLATQNPSGTIGTQMLPPAQMDRFLISMSIGYPDFYNEIAMAKGMEEGRPTDRIQEIADSNQLREMQKQVQQVYVDDAIYEYITKLIVATRENTYIQMGASPRGTIALVKMSKAAAWLNGNDFVTPQDVLHQFPFTVKHRIVLNGKARMDGVHKEAIIEGIISDIHKPSFERKWKHA